MNIYTLIIINPDEVLRYTIRTIVASYLNEEEAIQKLEYLRKTEHERYLTSLWTHSPHKFVTPLREYDMIYTKLIIDKFTESALGATNEQSDTY